MDISNKEKIFILKEELHNLLEQRAMIISDLNLLNKYIENLKEQIYSTCSHNWVIDYTSFSERTEYYCNICGLEK